jgi:hypothetical protein
MKVEMGKIVDAKKVRYGRADALKLAKSAAKLLVVRGKSVTVFDMKKPPKDAELTKAILGPTGNLRAPTMSIGTTMIVGFRAEVLAKYLR